MRHFRARDLVRYLLPSLATTGGEDLVYQWLEEGVAAVRERAWPWNWTEGHNLTYAEVTQTGATYTWVEGDNFVTSSAMVTLPYGITGRMVKLGDEWYRTIDVGILNPNRIYVNRAILGSQSTGGALTFQRADFGVRTSKLRNVDINGLKLPRVSPAYWSSHFGMLTWAQQGPSRPRLYTEVDSRRLQAPAYSPVVVDSGNPSTFTLGTYQYFYVRFDAENGLESPPGPPVTFKNTTGNTHDIAYGNATDEAESLSYGLRLYRSAVNPRLERGPMYRVQSRSPALAGAPFEDTFVAVNELPRFWDGPFSMLMFFPFPEARYSVRVEHVNNWNYRVADDDQIELGNDNQVLELLRLYLTGCVGLGNRQPDEHKKALIAFRSQLNYLLTVSRDAGNDDQGPENYVNDVPGDVNDDWVDLLQWKV